jgi:hypothetical protein
MLKVVEYGIFAVSMLAILGLIIGSRRARPVAGQGGPALSVEPSERGAAPLGSSKKD